MFTLTDRYRGRPGVKSELKANPMQPSTREPLPLRRAQRCLAKTRRGTPCQSPATKHGRCRMHGGAPGTGAPKGERNGSWKHGRYSREHIEMRRAIKALLCEARSTLETLND
jgi:hypothetical protein